MEKRLIRLSKFLSLVLRHEPQKVGIQLDDNGWVAIPELLSACDRRGVRMTRDDLDWVVAENDKKRFAISEDGLSIRASQGHSVKVDLGYEPAIPPDNLYHGTAERFLGSIREKGLVKGNRHHVHLSSTFETAVKVGSRRGTPTVLTVRATAMHQDGRAFFVSDNGVWLTDEVPGLYLVFP